MDAYSTTEKRVWGDVAQYESEPDYNRDEVVLLAGSGATRPVEVGQVLGQLTSGGKWKELATSGSNGDQVAKAVVVRAATAADGADGSVLVLARGPAILRKSQLVWPAGQNDAFKTARIAELLAIGIKVLAD